MDILLKKLLVKFASLEQRWYWLGDRPKTEVSKWFEPTVGAIAIHQKMLAPRLFKFSFLVFQTQGIRTWRCTAWNDAERFNSWMTCCRGIALRCPYKIILRMCNARYLKLLSGVSHQKIIHLRRL